MPSHSNVHAMRSGGVTSRNVPRNAVLLPSVSSIEEPPVATRAGVELVDGHLGPVRPPPLGELLAVGERLEHALARGVELAHDVDLAIALLVDRRPGAGLLV